MEVQGRPRGALQWPEDCREDLHCGGAEWPGASVLACLQGGPASHPQAALPRRLEPGPASAARPDLTCV